MTDLPPPARPEVLEFLLSRRSRPAKMLRAPAPDRTVLTRLLTAAARVPDHGKLEPWRFVVLEQAALARLGTLCAERGLALGEAPEKTEKAAATFRDSPFAVAVIAAPKPSDKIPEVEQLLSAGAVCLSLVNAALAQGYGACWLTGFAAHDHEFCARGLGLSPTEKVAGFIHIGTTDATPPERPRPDVASITRWVED
ncbi:nitroreductase [Pararhodobacter sp. SW119]|uniref:nitroreductase family protein n=1 Tax=Pararhodobacter sp. SW119 TaxID=2780075 RepID=UPI001AE0AE88|nr:nitroreductase [Pararhodobacter sp. SW119]